MQQNNNFFSSEVSGEFNSASDQSAKKTNRWIGLDFLKIIKENLTETTFHSIASIYNTPDPFLRVTLFVCFIASTAFCCYLAVKTVISFTTFDVLTSTAIVPDIPAECKN
jgi:hypothetical protein